MELLEMFDNMDLEDDQKQVNELLQNLLFERGLYSPVDLNEEPLAFGLLKALNTGNFQVDGYCVNCKKDTVFFTQEIRRSEAQINLNTVSADKISGKNKWLPDLNFNIVVHCSRDPKHFYRFFLMSNNCSLLKVGQWPSFADLLAFKKNQYGKVLQEIDRIELNKAINLNGHDVSIGAYVYLRRIFERLIAEAEELFKKEEGKEAVEVPLRILDKITFLGKYLPNILVENKEAYSILSKGIHELDEETCSAFFPVLEDAITLILDESIEKKNKINREKKLKKDIQGMLVQLKKDQATNESQPKLSPPDTDHQADKGS